MLTIEEFFKKLYEASRLVREGEFSHDELIDMANVICRGLGLPVPPEGGQNPIAEVVADHDQFWYETLLVTREQALDMYMVGAAAWAYYVERVAALEPAQV